MDNRIVVGIERELADKTMLVRLYEPSVYSGTVRIDASALDEVVTLAETLALKNTSGAVEAFGDALFSLLQKHPGFKEGVLSKLRHGGDAKPVYLYFEHPVPDLEALPWEALHTQSVGFLSQVRNYAVARAVNTSVKNSVWMYDPPLRIMAVLGAAPPPSDDHGDENEKRAFSANGQWAALRNAVLSERQLPCEVCVLTCEDDVKLAVTSENLPWASARMITSGPQLLEEIRTFRPNILHFFCHGHSAPVPQLEIATRRDWTNGDAGSIVLEGSHLGQNAGDATWLVTLNCCESAQGVSASGSPVAMPLASTIVSYGVPVVVGMREPIDLGVADSFSRLFYQNLLEELNRCVTSAAESGHSDVHWACGMFRVRQSLSDASRPLAWTMPVMHTRLENFLLKLGPGATQPARRRKLPEEQERDLCEEACQLQEDRELVAGNRAVVGAIDRQLARIEKMIEKNRSPLWNTRSNSPDAWKLMLTLAAGVAIGWKARSARIR